MTTQNAIKKLIKAGFKVEHSDSGFKYWATKNNEVVEFINQSDRAICIKSRYASDKDDAMTDYSAGVWCDNISQAIRLSMN